MCYLLASNVIIKLKEKLNCSNLKCSESLHTLTLEADVSKVQYGCQQLEDFLILAFCEGQDLHRRTNALEVFCIIPAFTHNTAALQHTRGRVQTIYCRQTICNLFWLRGQNELQL